MDFDLNRRQFMGVTGAALMAWAFPSFGAENAPVRMGSLVKGRKINIASMTEGIELGEKTAQMHRLEIAPATVQANKPGANPGEDKQMAFGDDPKKKFCQIGWNGNA